MRAAIQNEEQELMSLSYLAGTESLSSQMPISSQRALRACEAVIVDDIKCAEFLSRLPDHVLDSPFLSKDRTDEYIIASRWQVRSGSGLHAWLSFLLFLHVLEPLYGQAVEVAAMMLKVRILFKCLFPCIHVRRMGASSAFT